MLTIRVIVRFEIPVHTDKPIQARTSMVPVRTRRNRSVLAVDNEFRSWWKLPWSYEHHITVLLGQPGTEWYFKPWVVVVD